MTSVRKVAAEAGVSPSTVSRILNNEPDVDADTRARVLAIANRLGYRARIGRRVDTLIGLALPPGVPSDLGSFNGALVAGASQGCRDHGFNLMLVDMVGEKRLNEAYTHLFARIGVRGILLRRIPDQGQVLEELTRESFPHVLIADRSENGRVAYIYTDSLQPSVEAIRHLFELGHRRILVGRYSRGGHDTDDRFAAYRRAHEEAGIPVDERLVIDCGDGIDDGARAIDQALSLPDPPTAAYITHSMSSLGALRRLFERGLRVPDDFSFVAFDDCVSRDYMHPRSTVVAQNTFEMAREAASWLIRSLDVPGATKLRRVLNGTFEVNGSTTLAPKTPLRVLPDGRMILTGHSGPPSDPPD